MSKELSSEWQQRIETEGYEITKRFKDNNDYQSGYIQGVHDGYDQGATKYVKELIEAQERIKSLESIVSEVAKYYVPDEPWAEVFMPVVKKAFEALSLVNPKKKEDG